MSEIFTKIGGFVASGDAMVYADSATMTGDGTVASPFGVNKMDMFVQAPLFTGTSGEGDNTSAYIGCSGYNETVLWENTNKTFTKDLQWPQTLSEPITNFEKVSFLYAPDSYIEDAQYYVFDAYNNYNYNLVAWRCDGPGNNYIFWREAKFNCSGTSLTNPYNSTINLSTAFVGGGFNRDGYNWLLKVVGINRKPEA